MESLKKFSTIENKKAKPLFDVEGLSQYKDYIQSVVRESERNAREAWQRTKDIILDNCSSLQRD